MTTACSRTGLRNCRAGRLGQWNYDITLSFETNRQLLLQAGFNSVEGPWFVDGAAAVLVAR